MDIAETPGQFHPTRPVWHRIGIVALNLPAPGLGLLRLGRPREALLFYCVPLVLWIAIFALWWMAPPLGFLPLAACYALLAVSGIGALLGSAWRSWKLGAPAPVRPRPWWARWYAIAAAAIAAIVISQTLPAWGHQFYKPYFLPSEAMTPTLLTNDHIIALMRGPWRLRRGDVILFRVADATYIKRVAALPGDRIALVDGIVMLNGAAVPQQFERTESFRGWVGQVKARRLAERFPGEAGQHEIYDQEASVADNFPETRILPGHVFVLGDNRDMSADSRIERGQGGVEQLPIGDITGRALYYTYGPSHRMGQRIDPE